MSSLLDSRTRSHVGGRPGALVDCCSEAVADRSGSGGLVAAWATMRKSRSGDDPPTFNGWLGVGATLGGVVVLVMAGLGIAEGRGRRAVMGFPGDEVLREQASRALVIEGCTCGCAAIEFGLEGEPQMTGEFPAPEFWESPTALPGYAGGARPDARPES